MICFFFSISITLLLQPFKGNNVCLFFYCRSGIDTTLLNYFAVVCNVTVWPVNKLISYFKTTKTIQRPPLKKDTIISDGSHIFHFFFGHVSFINIQDKFLIHAIAQIL